ncbi:RNA exonuclease 1 homolog [Nephila pilipes]|uniref:RNA exonuclease 1 homolog n=1 Tax=Nephila pilipes TaxID=299642 RepID=A0A8X6PIL5_NEPPI|nr:RNA exonuclease 1 homolog [Nephila pilipes]
MSALWIYSILNTHKNIDDYGLVLVCVALLIVYLKLKIFDEKGIVAMAEPLVTLMLYMISIIIRSNTVEINPEIPKKKNKRVKKGPVAQEKKNCLPKLNKKKKKIIEKSTPESDKAQKATKFYPVLDSYIELGMDKRELYGKLLPFVLNKKQLEANNYPSEASTFVRKTVPPEQSERFCLRCKRAFVIRDDKYVSDTKCQYHPKKCYGYPRTYECCYREIKAPGCTETSTHVTDAIWNPWKLEYTRFKRNMRKDEEFSIYAIDTEMSYTTNGLEITKVGIVDHRGETVYEQLVKPLHPILDYNTAYSGVTEDDLKYVNVTLADVRDRLLGLIFEDTIIVGHALNCDLAALGMIHTKVIDTSVIYRKKCNANLKPSLKELAADHLNKTIQGGNHGHDCIEDARTSLELAFKKISYSFRTEKYPSQVTDADVAYALFKSRFEKYQENLEGKENVRPPMPPSHNYTYPSNLQSISTSRNYASFPQPAPLQHNYFSNLQPAPFQHNYFSIPQPMPPLRTDSSNLQRRKVFV